MDHHARLTIEQAHRSYVRGCHCKHCTKGHAAYNLGKARERAALRTNGTSRRVSHETAQMSLLDTEPTEAELRAAAASIFDGQEELSRPSQPRTGKHHRNARRTEADAAFRVATKTGQQRVAIIEALVDRGSEGYIDHELAKLLNLPLQSINPRRGELVEGGWVEDSRKTRKGPNERLCTVWVATERGKRWVNRKARVPA